MVPGNSSFDGGVDDIEFEECEQVWVSDGVDMRTNCLILLDSEPSASTSFLSGSLGFSSVLQLAEEVFACSDLLPATPAEASRIVIESDYAIRIFLPEWKTYGTFFETKSEMEWMLTSTAMRELLFAHNYIDKKHTNVPGKYNIT